MIENYVKDAAGNLNFTFQGVGYRVFAGNIDIFTQQEVFALVKNASTDEGDFDPFSLEGVKSQRKLLSFLQHIDGDNVNDLSQAYQKQFFSSGKFKDTLPEGVRPFEHTAHLSVLAQHLVLYEGYQPEKKRKAAQAKKSNRTSNQAATKKKLKETSGQ